MTIRKFIEAIPFICNCPDAKRISFRNKLLFFMDRFFGSFNATSQSYDTERIKILFDFIGDETLKKKCLKVLRGLMWMDYKTDIKEDVKKNKFNPFKHIPTAQEKYDKAILDYESASKERRIVPYLPTVRGWWR